MQYFLLFLEGMLTFISPCLLPMLPVYISFFAAGKPDKRRTFINAAGFVIGFTLVFITLGAFAGTAGRLLNEYTAQVNIVTGLAVIVMGFIVMGIININFFNSRVSTKGTASVKVTDLRFFSSLLFGIVFSISWTPCAGAFLGAALMKASAQGSALGGITMLFVYSLGLGIPLMVSAVLIDRLKDAFDFIKRNYKIITMISGILLVIMGILMMLGVMGRWLSLITF